MHVLAEVRADENEATALPSRVHAVVLVSKIHKPALRALAYARATRPSTLEALTVQVDEIEVAALQDEWERRAIPVPLKVLDSPYREVTRPILDYVRSLRRASPHPAFPGAGGGGSTGAAAAAAATAPWRRLCGVVVVAAAAGWQRGGSNGGSMTVRRWRQLGGGSS